MDTKRIADTIAASDNQKTMYDAACKMILGDKIVLAKILSEYVEEFKGLSASEIANNYIDSNTVKSSNIVGSAVDYLVGNATDDLKFPGATIKYDILFNALIPGTDDHMSVIINVEAQNKDNPGYPLLKRAFYYASRLIAGQKNDPNGFSNSNYGDIKKVYSIWICLNSPVEKRNSVNLYSISETHLDGSYCANEEHYDIMSVVMIYLQGEYNNNEIVDSAKKMLDMLFASNLNKEEKFKHMQDYGIMTVKTEEGISSMCNFSDSIYEKGFGDALLIADAKHALRLVNRMKLTLEQAAEELGIDKASIPAIRKLIESGKVAE